MEPKLIVENAKLSQYLISPSSYMVARIKYSINEQETELKRCLTADKHRIDYHRARDFAHTIADLYAKYSKFHISCLGYPLIEDNHLSFSKWTDCYSYILTLNRDLQAVENIYLVGKIVCSLSECYNILSKLLNSEVVQCPRNSQCLSGELPIKAKNERRNPREWLNSLIKFANQSYKSSNLINFSGVSLQNEFICNNGSETFPKDYMELSTAIYFYKIFPEKLYVGAIQLEELMAAKLKLILLYQLIEAYYEFCNQNIKVHDGPLVCDFLFHGEELPQGVELKITRDYDELIIRAINDLKINIEINDQINSDAKDLLRAYKFSFKPIRLVDVAMSLVQDRGLHLYEDELCSSSDKSDRGFFREMTTTDCLDLYGYFSNKDTYYFMQVLYLAHSTEKPSWLRVVNHHERAAIKRVFIVLTIVMDDLRDELYSRKISTEQYNFDKPSLDKIVPRTRHRNVLNWIMSVYIDCPSIANNNKVEELFRQLN